MNKERAFLFLSLALGILLVGVIVVMITYIVLYYKLKNRVQALADYAYRMVNQTQNVINATTKVRGFYKKYTYFDADLEDENAETVDTTVSISGSINGTDISGGSNCTGDYDNTTACISGVSGQIYRQYDVDELLQNLGVASSFNDSSSTQGNYLEFSYQYPTDGPTVAMHFDLPDLSSSADASTVISSIMKNWRNAMFEHQGPSDSNKSS